MIRSINCILTPVIEIAIIIQRYYGQARKLTITELQAVNRLTTEIARQEQKLQSLIDSQWRVTATLDGMPRGDRQNARIEVLIVAVDETERRLERLQAELTATIPLLAQKIKAEFSDPIEQSLLLQRYIFGFTFVEIAVSLNYTTRGIYKLHSRILQRISGGFD